MVLAVSRAWTCLWAANLENQGIQSKPQASFPSPPAASSSDYKWILFLKASPDFLKTCSSLLKFTKGKFQMRAVLFSAPSLWSVLFVSFPVSLCGLPPLVLSSWGAHHCTLQPGSPDKLQSDFPLAICQKQAIQGQLPWKDLPAGLLASWTLAELQESKERIKVNITDSISFQDTHCFSHLQRIFRTFHSKWTLTRDGFSVLIYCPLQSLVSKVQSFKPSINTNHFLSRR